MPARLVIVRDLARALYARGTATTVRHALPRDPELAETRLRALLAERGLALDEAPEFLPTHAGSLVLAPPLELREL